MDAGIFWLGGMWLFPIIIGGGLILILKKGSIKLPWESTNQFYKTEGEKQTALKNLEEKYKQGEIKRKDYEEIKKRFFE